MAEPTAIPKGTNEGQLSGRGAGLFSIGNAVGQAVVRMTEKRR
jgi:hypothetical protein